VALSGILNGESGAGASAAEGWGSGRKVPSFRKKGGLGVNPQRWAIFAFYFFNKRNSFLYILRQK